jgi:nucleotide-binding universal stress UspA family protein
MIVICFDGSADAEAAIDHAAVLMAGAEAVVLTIWEPFVDMMTRCGSLGMGSGMTGGWTDNGDIDAAAERAAVQTATRGAERASNGGLIARPRTAERRDGIARAVLEVAEELDAQMIVLGTRGLSGVKSMMLGSVSHTLVHHAERPVLIVPAPSLVTERREWATHTHATADAG